MARLVFRKLDHEVADFSCGNGSIETQLRSSYYECLLDLSFTYEVSTEDGRVMGYYCVALYHINPTSLPDDMEEIDLGRSFDYPAVEIKFLAIQKSLQKQGMGNAVLTAVIQRLQEYHELLPFRFIYIEALKELIPWYRRFDFTPLKQEDFDSAVQPMIRDLNTNEASITEYLGE